MPGQGNAFTVKEKEMIVGVKDYFDSRRKVQGKQPRGTKGTTTLTAEALGVSVVSVQRIVREFKDKGNFAPPAPKGSRPYTVDDSVKTICQDIIRASNIKRDHISIRVLTGTLKENHKIEVPRETLRAYLSRWGVVYGPVLRHTALRERDYVVNARRDYLIKKRKLRSGKKTLVYLDETFVNKNYSGSDNSWYCEDWQEDTGLDKSYGPFINKPSGKGERMILVNAITDDGWVEGAKCVFKANSVTGDYHGSMNESTFKKWFCEQLLPNIPDNSVVIMDNASYHNMYSEDGVPPLNSRKTVLQKWLQHNGVKYDELCLRPQLIELIREHRPKRKFLLDDMLCNDPEYKHRNIEILRTPQYHPELQPIEKCWAVMKQYIGKNCDFTKKGLLDNIQNSWAKVTMKTMRGIMEKVQYWEDYHFQQDDLLDDVDESECI
jgi:transposase